MSDQNNENVKIIPLGIEPVDAFAEEMFPALEEIAMQCLLNGQTNRAAYVWALIKRYNELTDEEKHE